MARRKQPRGINQIWNKATRGAGKLEHNQQFPETGCQSWEGQTKAMANVWESSRGSRQSGHFSTDWCKNNT